MIDITQHIKSIIDDTPMPYFGLRVEAGRKFALGEYLPPTWQLFGDAPDTLGGVSTIGIDVNDTDNLTAALRAYVGDSIVLVAGDRATDGLGERERIIYPGICLGCWDRN